MSAPPAPFVLLHGFTGCGEVWDDVKSALMGEYLCLAPDLPGHGSHANELPADAFGFTGVCALLNKALDQAGAEDVYLWGYSMGGRIALHFALAHPERVRALILESASPGIANDDARRQRLRDDEALAARLVAEGLEQFVDQWMDQPLFLTQKSLSPERQALGRRLRMQNNAESLAAALLGFSVGRQKPLRERLPQLSMPVLVVAGELDAKYRGLGEELARSIPDSQFRIISGAGHAPHWERPVDTAAVAAEFLKRAEDGFPPLRE